MRDQVDTGVDRSVEVKIGKEDDMRTEDVSTELFIVNCSLQSCKRP